jgi:hypothetical protein
MDPELKTMFAGLIEAQRLTDQNLNTMIKAQMTMDERLTAAHERTEAAIAEVAAATSRYITSSDDRTKRLEENLDALIRAITREHSNGKAH